MIHNTQYFADKRKDPESWGGFGPLALVKVWATGQWDIMRYEDLRYAQEIFDREVAFNCHQYIELLGADNKPIRTWVNPAPQYLADEVPNAHWSITPATERQVTTERIKWEVFVEGLPYQVGYFYLEFGIYNARVSVMAAGYRERRDFTTRDRQHAIDFICDPKWLRCELDYLKPQVAALERELKNAKR